MKPLVLIPGGEGDADFTYATGFAVETGLYLRFAEHDDVLVVSPLEIERARVQSKTKKTLELDAAGYENHGPFVSHARPAARLLRERSAGERRACALLPAGFRVEFTGPGSGR